jgi:hypothetical protein
MLFGAALIFIPVIGSVVILGPLAAAIVGAIEGGVEGAVVVGVISAPGGALSAIGILKNSGSAVRVGAQSEQVPRVSDR